MPNPDGTVPWRELLAECEQRLASAGIPDPALDARRIVEEASGFEGAELFLALGEPVTERAIARFDDMVGRRCTGEPLQYVLGHWAFRTLDLAVDRRVLIPRPETEVLVDVVLEELRRVRAAGAVERSLVDLGTGSGAIALSVAAEAPGVDVWATDRSADAAAVARANLAGLGTAASRVRIVEGSWFDALPDGLRGGVHVLASNPPYIADGELLDPVVADWEPVGALRAGPSGTEDLAFIIEGAVEWLVPEGALVLELAPEQAAPMAGVAARWFTEVAVRRDLVGRDRVLVARVPRSGSAG